MAVNSTAVRMNNTLRKDGKKDCCFEIAAPDKRIYQFTAATPKEAREWVQKLRSVLQDPGSEIIPVDDEEYDDIGASGMPSPQGPTEDDIYEELPGIEGLHSLENLCRSGGSADACDQNTVRQ
uniref:PH domain-containing protein n=1 Tax=Varanus komodoensis TaxID=61221 RepID=A0A8D2Q4W5_VARKO